VSVNTASANTASVTTASVTTAMPPSAARGSALGRLAVTELKLLIRERSRIIITFAIPLVLVIIFGSIPFYNDPRAVFGGLTLLDVYVPILVAYSLAVICVTALSMTMADYRERGVLRRLRTTPAGPLRVLAAQVMVDLAVAVVAVSVILVVARIGYGVFLPRQLAGFALAALLAAAELIALGLAIAAVAPNGRTAMTAAQMLALPMMFFAGLFIPVPAMSDAMQHVCHATPLGAAVEALQYAAQGHWPQPLPMLTMAAYAAGLGIAAARLFRWE
jgi:ABC-2 type transport system permease protein